MTERFKPYRTELTALAEGDLRRANAGRPGDVPAWEPYEVSLARMETEPHDADQIVAWLTHPDERVVMAALADERWGLMVHERRRLQEIVVKRALLDAQRDGSTWTPIIEKLIAWDMWEGFAFVDFDANALLKAMGQRLASWLETEAEEADVRELVAAFDGLTVSRFVASNARVLPDDVVSPLLERGLAVELAGNAALSDQGAEKVAAAALSLLRSGRHQSGAAQVNGVMQAFRRRRYRLSEAIVDRLLDAIRNVPGPIRNEIRQRLTHYPFLPGSRLVAICDASGDSAPDVAALVQNAREAGIEFYRHVARNYGSANVHARLAEIELARSDAVVRDALIRQGNIEAMMRLWPEVAADEFPRVIAAMMKEDEEATAKWIRENGLPSHLSLSPLDLAPLLEAESGQLRQIALTHLSVAREHVRQERETRSRRER